MRSLLLILNLFTDVWENETWFSQVTTLEEIETYVFWVHVLYLLLILPFICYFLCGIGYHSNSDCIFNSYPALFDSRRIQLPKSLTPLCLPSFELRSLTASGGFHFAWKLFLLHWCWLFYSLISQWRGKLSCSPLLLLLWRGCLCLMLSLGLYFYVSTSFCWGPSLLVSQRLPYRYFILHLPCSWQEYGEAMVFSIQ